VGEDYTLTRNDNSRTVAIIDYNLLPYVGIPDTGARPVVQVDTRGDLEMRVRWKNSAGVDIPLPFETFLDDTVYSASRNEEKTGIIDYNLLTYVPIPNAGEQPVVQALNRTDLELCVLWKDAGAWKSPRPLRYSRPIRCILRKYN
jgi:hypothetical protein